MNIREFWNENTLGQKVCLIVMALGFVMWGVGIYKGQEARSQFYAVCEANGGVPYGKNQLVCLRPDQAVELPL